MKKLILMIIIKIRALKSFVNRFDGEKGRNLEKKNQKISISKDNENISTKKQSKGVFEIETSKG